MFEQNGQGDVNPAIRKYVLAREFQKLPVYMYVTIRIPTVLQELENS